MTQRKILRMIHVMGKVDSVSGDYIETKILTVFEFYMYDLLKLCMRSCNCLYSTTFLNTTFTPLENPNKTRSNRLLYQKPFCGNKQKSYSIENKGSKLFNLLGENDLLPPNLG